MCCTNTHKRHIRRIWGASLKVLFRILSVADLITDILLLIAVENQEVLNMHFAMILFVSIVSPYILSYSCGVKHFFIRGFIHSGTSNSLVSNSETSNETQFLSKNGIETFFNALYLLPCGVLYFILLDVVDLFFVLYKFWRIAVFSDDDQALYLVHEKLCQQLGMDTMHYEGLTRQRLQFYFILICFFVCCFCSWQRGVLLLMLFCIVSCL